MEATRDAPLDSTTCSCLAGLTSKIFSSPQVLVTTAELDSPRLFIWTEDQKHRPVWTAKAQQNRGAPHVAVLERPVSRQKLAELFRRQQGIETSSEQLHCYLLPDGGLIEDADSLRDGDRVLLRGGACGGGTRQILRQVTVQTKILGLSRIDTVAQMFHADFVVVLTWVEECLVGISEDKVDWSLVFHPAIDIRNACELEELTHFGDPGLTRLRSSDGQITAVHRFKGALAQSMELEAFPFDTQQLCISIGTRGQNISEVTLNPHTGAVKIPPEAHSSLSDWKLGRITQHGLYTDPEHALHQSVYSLVQVRVQVVRLPAFYMTNIVAVLFGIVSMSFLSFLFSPDALGSRLDLNCTLLLAAIGFKAYAAETLPKISLFTALDCYIVAIYSFLYIVVLENAAVCLVSNLWSVEAALLVDRACFVTYFALFAALHAWVLVWVRDAQERDHLTHQGRQAGAGTMPSAYHGVLAPEVEVSQPVRLWHSISGMPRRLLERSMSGASPSPQPKLRRGHTSQPTVTEEGQEQQECRSPQQPKLFRGSRSSSGLLCRQGSRNRFDEC